MFSAAVHKTDRRTATGGQRPTNGVVGVSAPAVRLSPFVLL